jgi:hypothetical protein
MHKLLLAAVLAALGLPLGSAAIAAGTSETELLGKDPGSAAAYSCFTRHYDDAHLAAHPRQNVRNMSVFVESTFDKDDGRSDYLNVGVEFRALPKPFQISGGCSPLVVNGKETLRCGGDCDGGQFNVSTRGADAIVLSIPDRVSLWDPAASDDAPGDLPKGAELGKDDKAFRLDRVDVKVCSSLMSDDAKDAIFGKH